MNAPSASDRPNVVRGIADAERDGRGRRAGTARGNSTAPRAPSAAARRAWRRATVTAEQHEARGRSPAITRMRPPAGLLNSGSTIISGTTARSWTTSMPSITRLESVPIRPCACSVFSATIVLDNAMSAPNQSAGCQAQPNA